MTGPDWRAACGTRGTGWSRLRRGWGTASASASGVYRRRLKRPDFAPPRVPPEQLATPFLHALSVNAVIGAVVCMSMCVCVYGVGGGGGSGGKPGALQARARGTVWETRSWVTHLHGKPKGGWLATNMFELLPGPHHYLHWQAAA
jgi:hypothetical protein